MIQTGPAACLIRKKNLGKESEDGLGWSCQMPVVSQVGIVRDSCDINARDPIDCSKEVILECA